MSNENEYDGLKWDNSYLLGHEKIDAQHRELFNKVNSLLASCDDGSNTEEINEMLLFMVNYAVKHFVEEEALQIGCDYPDYERHKKLHDDFRTVVTGLIYRFSISSSSIELSKDVKKIVIEWLINHIMNEDKKIGDYLKEISIY